MRLSENFVLQEFVPKGMYEKYGDSCIWFIDNRIIEVAQFFRDRYGKPITINDWHKGGLRNHSGWRYPNSGVGAPLSQHKFGRAVDLKWPGLSPYEVREDIKNNWREFKNAGLQAVEKGTDTWIHADIRYTGRPDILFLSYY